MKTAHIIGCGGELLLLGLVVWLFRFGLAVGVIAVVIWLCFGFGVMTLVGWDTANPPAASSRACADGCRIGNAKEHKGMP